MFEFRLIKQVTDIEARGRLLLKNLGVQSFILPQNRFITARMEPRVSAGTRGFFYSDFQSASI
jgi:hypothetical protein